ncbi:hypothetical protein BHE74_00043028 [Ensete ventricosum]|nr:hypothetical protein BHE74_00043028 [Ensete ventricosum]
MDRMTRYTSVSTTLSVMGAVVVPLHRETVAESRLLPKRKRNLHRNPSSIWMDGSILPMEKISQKEEEQGGREDTGAAWTAAGDDVEFFIVAEEGDHKAVGRGDLGSISRPLTGCGGWARGRIIVARCPTFPSAPPPRPSWPPSVSSASGSASHRRRLPALRTIEYADKKTRGAFIAAVFAMQGFGILAGGIGAVIVSAGWKNKYNVPDYSVDPVGSTVPEANYVWRIILMFGSVPAGLTYYWRMKMPETVGSTRPGLFAKEY